MRVDSILKPLLVFLSALACSEVVAVTSCTVVPGPTLAFGKIVPLSKVTTNAEAEIRVRCEVVGAAPIGNQVSAVIRISQGNSASYAPRKLFNSGGVGDAYQIGYNLYTQSSGGLIWGDGTNGTSEVTLTISGLTEGGPPRDNALIVYGRLPDIPNTKRAGAYTDSLIISISY